jgi:hypothetical protein
MHVLEVTRVCQTGVVPCERALPSLMCFGVDRLFQGYRLVKGELAFMTYSL